MTPPSPTAPTPSDRPAAGPAASAPTAAGGSALRLTRESFGPRVELVAFGGSGPASDAEREELARVALSRASGSHVVIATTGAAAGASATQLPADVERLASGGSLALAFLGAEWRIVAPRGAGRVLLPAGLELAKARAAARALADAATRGEFERSFDAAAASLARDPALAHAQLGEGEADALDHAALNVADPREAAALHHAIERGGELCLEPLPAGGPLAARLVRGRERFLLELRRSGRPLARESLVLLRYTAAADAGARLRVELDDEDLGPWRLGEPGGGGSLDLFRIPGDLLTGREQIALAFTVAEEREVASMRWRFLVEEEIDGIWLTDLDAMAATEPLGSLGPLALHARDVHGRLLQLAGRDRTRGFRVEPGAAVAYAIPAGYRRLELTAGAVGARGAALAIELDGVPAAAIELPDAAAARDVALPIAGPSTIRIAASGSPGSSLLVVDPKLLR